MLLTAEDLEHRIRYLNARNTLVTLMELGAIPIINENDTVSVEELQNHLRRQRPAGGHRDEPDPAPLLVLLSDVEGLYDGDPREPGRRVIPTVDRLDGPIYDMVRDRASGLSKGGMASKLEAARLATSAGENVIIASGRTPNVLSRILAGEPVGTLFLAQGQIRGRAETLDRLHGQAARPPDPRRRRPRGRRSARAAACWPPGSSASRPVQQGRRRGPP